MGKNNQVYQIRGEVEYQNLHAVMNSVEQLPDLIRFMITLTKHDQDMERLMRQQRLRIVNYQGYKSLRFIDIVGSSQHDMQDLYAHIKPFLVKDTSRL